jgi:hypothetical protein
MSPVLVARCGSAAYEAALVAAPATTMRAWLTRAYTTAGGPLAPWAPLRAPCTTLRLYPRYAPFACTAHMYTIPPGPKYPTLHHRPIAPSTAAPSAVAAQCPLAAEPSMTTLRPRSPVGSAPYTVGDNTSATPANVTFIACRTGPPTPARSGVSIWHATWHSLTHAAGHVTPGHCACTPIPSTLPRTLTPGAWRCLLSTVRVDAMAAQAVTVSRPPARPLDA